MTYGLEDRTILISLPRFRYLRYDKTNWIFLLRFYYCFTSNVLMSFSTVNLAR